MTGRAGVLGEVTPAIAPMPALTGGTATGGGCTRAEGVSASARRHTLATFCLRFLRLADDGAWPGFKAASAASSARRASIQAGDFIGSPARGDGACANDAACTATRSAAPAATG